MDSCSFGDSATHSGLARDDFELEIADFEDDAETDSSGFYMPTLMVAGFRLTTVSIYPLKKLTTLNIQESEWLI